MIIGIEQNTPDAKVVSSVPRDKHITKTKMSVECNLIK